MDISSSFYISWSPFLSQMQHQTNPNSFILSIRKDTATLKYSTTIEMGTPPNLINAAIDLGGQLLWFDCCNGYNSSSYHPILLLFSPMQIRLRHWLSPKPGCSNGTCGLCTFNPYNIDSVFLHIWVEKAVDKGTGTLGSESP